MKELNALSKLADNADAFLLDLWGCVHDGSALYPHALDCLEAMRAEGKRVIFLSNAPRRAIKAQAVLDALGVSRDLYEAVMTSGEAAHGILRNETKLPAAYYFIGPERDADVLAGLDYARVGSVEEAGFLLNAGFGTEEQTALDFSGLLAAAKARDLPMLCLNPDMEVVKITGERYPCAGVIAAAYEKLGGRVRYFGKPYPEVYKLTLRMLNVGANRVMAVGDGLMTDILGARNAGIANVLVTGGLLHHEQDVQAYLSSRAVLPDYLMEELRW